MRQTENMAFMFHLNQFLREEERIFKLQSAILSEQNLTIKLLYSARDAQILTDLLKNKVLKYCKTTLPDSLYVEIEYIRTFTDETTVKTALMTFLYDEAVLVYPKIKNSDPLIDVTPYVIYIQLSVPEYALQYCINSDLKAKTEQFISNNFMEECELEFVSVPEDVFNDRGAVVKQRRTVKTIDIESNIDMLHWGALKREPRYIRDVLKLEESTQAVCGKVLSYRQMKTKDGLREFYLFRLDDTTGIIDCKAFPRSKHAHPNFKKIEDNMQLAVEGLIKDDKFSKGKAIFVDSFTQCKINYDSINDNIEFLPLPQKYATILPTPYVEETYEQFDIFHLEQKIPEQLKGKTFVVFDVETTGLEVMQNSIIEFAGVKMVDGKITETLTTLIEPVLPEGERRSAENIKINGITDEMLEGAPKPFQVAGDIYKFCYGATLVGHNVDFDISFLKKFGNENGYLFDHKTVDTLQMARERFRGTNKLIDVCNRLEVSLIGAHRALNDAVATAKVFLKMFDIPLLQTK